MEQVKVIYDKEGNTLTVWFRKPEDEYICEETGEEIVFMKNKSGKVIGMEKLNYVKSGEEKEIEFEAMNV
jgi:uncharacterized protein YuzE